MTWGPRPSEGMPGILFVPSPFLLLFLLPLCPSPLTSPLFSLFGVPSNCLVVILIHLLLEM